MGEVRAYRQAAARDKDYGTAIRGCDVGLRALALLSARPATQAVSEDAFYYVSPSKPIDLERLAQLNEVIRQREPVCADTEPSSTTTGVPHVATRLGGGTTPDSMNGRAGRLVEESASGLTEMSPDDVETPVAKKRGGRGGRAA